MIGIVSYGGYIPRLRLPRMTMFQSMAWFAPATIAVAQGERSVCNWDEDALSMSVEAARDCLRDQDKSRVDAIFLASTTLPYADRQNSGIVSTALNLKSETLTADVTGSLKAGTSAMVTAFEALQGGKKDRILISASDRREAKAGYFYEMWFGDGAASLLLGKDDVIAELKGSHSISYDFPDHYRDAQKKYDYIWEERWIRDEGYTKILPEAIGGLLKKYGLSIGNFSKIVYPCFFSREHAAIGKKIGANPQALQGNMHEVTGEMGTAHPLAMFIHALEEAKPGDNILLASFGQGSDVFWFEVTENIAKLPKRNGIKESLAKRKEMDSYTKFCQFRDRLGADTGIRAEVSGQSPLSVLWRERKTILGLVGGRCKRCGTPQFPKMDVCVNPECHAMHEQEDYEFSERMAKIISFTGDWLAVSVDPPAIYGMVQFEGGGRTLLDFTDCDLGSVKVGQPARMSFRKRWYDKERGFHGYFWKAVPQQES